jgi:lipoate-protein ligase A
MTLWRLLITPPARGAWNMAVDESILEHIGRGASLPTLRLYAWTPACLSLGHAQPFADVDMARLNARAGPSNRRWRQFRLSWKSRRLSKYRRPIDGSPIT